MPETRVIHFRDWDRSNPNAVWIGRANGRLKVKQSPWANPFRIGDYHPRINRVMTTNEELVDAFAYWVECDRSDPRTAYIREHAHELRGTTMVCACKDKEHPTRPCHGDVLREMADHA